MLTLTMQIHEDGASTEGQARGVVAALVAMYGSAILPHGVPQRADERAPDGFPMAPQPPADNDHVEEGSTPFPTTPGAPGDLDKAGTPWDERIHSSSKSRNKDETWTRKRNTPDALFDSVMAELKGNAPAAPTPPAVPIPPADDTAAAAFGTPTPPAVPTPPAATGGAVPTSLALMTTITGLQKEGKIDHAGLTEILKACGIEGVAKVFSAGEDARAALAMTLAAM